MVATTSKAVFDTRQLLDITQSFLQSYGRLFAFVKVSCAPNGALRAIAEFCDISHTLKLITIFTQVTTPEVKNFATPFQNRFLLTQEGSPFSHCTVHMLKRIGQSARIDDT